MRRVGKTSVFVQQISNIPAELRRTQKKMERRSFADPHSDRVAQKQTEEEEHAEM